MYITIFIHEGNTMQKPKRLIIDIREEDHKRIKMMAAQLGMTIKEYVLKTIAKDMYEKQRLK